jgi:hypothetical protein
MSVRLFGLAGAVVLVAAWTNPAVRSVSYVARMSAGQETPANNTRGSGTATLSIDGTKLHYSIDAKDLSGSPTMAHIHVGAKGVAGPPVFTFPIKAGAGASGTISEGSVELTADVSAGISGDSLKTLLNNGHAYVNVHTKNFPGGEIRGQVMMKQ